MKSGVKSMVRLKRLSLCVCGYTLLQEEIPIGTIYFVDLGSQKPGALICGGCGRRHKVTLVHVDARRTSEAGWMPLEIFRDPETAPPA